MAQALTIAVLAYASGLLLGLSVKRGEIGRLRPGPPVPTGAPSASASHGRPRGFLRNLRHDLPQASANLRRYLALAVLVVALVGLALGAVTLALDMQAAPLIGRR